MIISTVTCKVFGKTTIELRDISELFTGYGDVFRQTFNLTDNAFNRIYKFKKDRGGFLVVIKDKKNGFQNSHNFLLIYGVFECYSSG